MLLPDSGEIKDQNFIPSKDIYLAFSERTHRFVVESSVDPSEFKQGEPYLVDEIDVTSLSQFAKPAQEGLSQSKAKEYLEYCHNAAIARYLQEMVATGNIRPASPGEINFGYGYHAGANSHFLGDNQIDKIEAMQKGGRYGGTGRVSYFSRKVEDALFHGLGNFNDVTLKQTRYPKTRILLLTLSLEKLRAKRNIFIDPESLLPAFQEEFGNTFIVHHGFPISAVKSVDVLRYEGTT